MSKRYASVSLGGPDRNAERLGALITWLIANRLLSVTLERENGSEIARVRMQDLTGSAFLTTVLHGELREEHLNEAGQQFLEDYLVSGRYDEDFASCSYEGENEWLRFDEVSPLITAAYRQATQPKPSFTAKILKFPGRRS